MTKNAIGYEARERKGRRSGRVKTKKALAHLLRGLTAITLLSNRVLSAALRQRAVTEYLVMRALRARVQTCWHIDRIGHLRASQSRSHRQRDSQQHC